MRARLVTAALLAPLLLAGCGSAPRPAEPPLVKAVLEAESDGAKRYGRGDHAVAARRFAEAARLAASIDDQEGAARNRRHLARAELALGRADIALALLAGDDSPEGRLALSQAQLALGRDGDARRTLATIDCAPPCPHAASLRLLQARAAADAAEAAGHAGAALALLKEDAEPAETANAWRALAAARLAMGDAASLALAADAAQRALEIDRRLALPEKIARDWLLLGDIAAKVSPGGMKSPEGVTAAIAAYRRALDVAEAAGIADVAERARRALGIQTPK